MTQLPNPFLNSTVSPRAVVSTADSACRLQNVARPDATAERDPHPISEPSVTNGGDPGAPASAPTKNPNAGACNCEYAHCEDFDRPDCRAKAAGLDPCPDGPTDCISEIFFYARKLMKEPPRFVLDEAAFMAEVEETPLFLREDGYLQRREA